MAERNKMKNKTLKAVTSLLPAKIHTIQITTNCSIDIDKIKSMPGLSYVGTDIRELTGEVLYNLKFNADKYCKNYVPHTADEYFKIADECLFFVDIDAYTISRIDVAIDNNVDDFDTTLKINRYLLSAMYCSDESLRNSYESRDFIQMVNLNCKLTSMANDIQIEYYNKLADAKRKKYNTGAKSRLELRMIGNIKYNNFQRYYLSLLGRALDSLVLAEKTANENLLIKYQHYKSDCNNEKRKQNSFIISNADCIYSKRQLISLLLMLNPDMTEMQAVKRASNLKSRHKVTLEYFTKSDMTAYINQLKKLIVDYGCCTNSNTKTA